MMYEIEYLDEEHLYLCNGEIVLSVTQILQQVFPDKYKGVPDTILKRKADYGTIMHEAIQTFEETGVYPELDYIQEASFKQYLELKEKNKLEVIEQEQIINYKDIYAGRFDMIANVNGEKCLLDIKTTTKLDKEYLSWQLSLYEYAYNSMHEGNKFEKLYAIWLPKKELGELVEIERKSEEKIKTLLEKMKGEDNNVDVFRGL